VDLLNETDAGYFYHELLTYRLVSVIGLRSLLGLLLLHSSLLLLLLLAAECLFQYFENPVASEENLDWLEYKATLYFVTCTSPLLLASLDQLTSCLF